VWLSLLSVVDRRTLAGWLGGPGSAYGGSGDAAAPGRDPSRASLRRRLAAITIDWVASLLIARTFTDSTWGPLLVFAVENVILLPTAGGTFGMRLLGVAVVRLDTGRPLLPLPAALRTLLLCIVVPAFVWDRDHRGLHDKAVGSAVVVRAAR
jgi:uncharacterized RDD family membrane protein YckC